jgi:TolB-like protein/DNA-binding winged helix-turn-helix (wHTH) protein
VLARNEGTTNEERKASKLLGYRVMRNLASQQGMVGSSQEPICFDRFTIDLRRGYLAAGVHHVPLRPGSFAVLCYLAANAGRLISKGELFTVLWPDSAVTDDALVQCVCEIRRALHDDERSFVRTVPRRGYLFDAPISRPRLPEAGTSPGSIDPGAATSNAKTSVGGSGGPLIQPIDEEFARRLSIAVIPLVNLSGDSEYEYLADGLTENLITDLSRVRDSMIITPNSVFSYKGKSVPAQQVAAELNVQYVLTGSLQRSGSHIRVNLQLIEAASGANLWAERFEYDGPDIWGWQDEVTRRIAGTLKLGLVEVASRRAAIERPRNPDVIDLTMRGLVLFSRFAGRADIVKARVLFEGALRLDPSSVQALVGFAGTHVLDVMLLWAGDPADQIRQAHAAIAQALEIDPQSAEVRYTRGNLLMLDGKHAEAIDEYRLALDLNPSFSHAYSRIGLAKLELGLPAEAVEPVLKALRLSPREFRTSLCYLYLGIAAFHLERDDEATVWLKKAVVADSRYGLPHAWLAAIRALAGRGSDAEAELAEFDRLTPGHTVATLRARERSKNPAFLAQRERFYQGFVQAGSPAV